MTKQNLVRLFTFLGGIYFFLEFFLPKEIGGFQFGKYHDQISTGFILVGIMAVGLGLINILLVHLPKVIFLKKGWFESSALLVGMLLMLLVTGADWYTQESTFRPAKKFNLLSAFAKKIENEKQKVPVLNKSFLDADLELHKHFPLEGEDRMLKNLLEQHEVIKNKIIINQDTDLVELAVNLNIYAATALQILNFTYEKTLINQLYKFLYQGLYVALGAAIFALLAFYVVSAAYRAFRIRTIESALMMFSALVVMLGQITFGVWLWDGFPEVRLWLLSVPSSGAFRAITIGASIAGLIMALRMWLSIETDYSGEEQ